MEQKKYKYYQWINPTKQKKEFIKEHDGGFVKKVDAETGETVEIIFVDIRQGETFKSLHLYTGEKVPFSGEIDETDIEITEQEYNALSSIALNADFISKRLFSQEKIDRYNERMRQLKDEKARAAQQAPNNKK